MKYWPFTPLVSLVHIPVLGRFGGLRVSVVY